MDNINLENKEALQQKLETLRAKDGFICDMDGVIYHGNRLLPGVKEFVDWLYRENKHFLFLTNSSERSPKELQQKLGRMGLDVDESHFYTSALATARFISSQAPGCSAYVIGGAGLIMALGELIAGLKFFQWVSPPIRSRAREQNSVFSSMPM